MKKIILSIFFYMFVFLLNGQPQIFPFTPLSFKDYEPIWTSIVMDTTIVDGAKYDGRHHIGFYNRAMPPIEDTNYIYTVSRSGLYDLEGGIVQKINKKTGTILWKKTFDRRIFDKNEYVYKILLKKGSRELYIISCMAKNTTPLNFPVMIFGTDVVWSIRKYSTEDGELLEHIYSKNPNYDFYSADLYISNNLFEAEDSFIYIKRSNASTNEYAYAICHLDDSLNIQYCDTVEIDLCDDKFNDQLIGGFMRYKNGYVSFDAKYLTSENKFILNLLFWNKDFQIEDSISSDILEEILDGFIVRGIRLLYVDENVVIIQVSHYNGSEFVYKNFILNHNGEKINEFNNGTILFYDKTNNCPYFSQTHYNSPYYYTTIYSLCDSINNSITLQPQKSKTAIHLKNAIITSEKNIILSISQSKDTTINNAHNLFYQASYWSALKGEDLGIKTNTENINKDRLIKLYPNPTDQFVNLEMDQNYEFIKCINQLGVSISISKKNNIFDFGNYPEGIYYLIFYDKTLNKQTVEKIIKIN